MKISVIGAFGDIGAAITFCLMQRALAHEIAMTDINCVLSTQKFSDMQAAAYLCQTIITHGDYETLTGSQIVIIAPGAHDNTLQTRMDAVLDAARAVSRYCPLATVIQVCEPLEPLSYALQNEAGLRPGQVLGYSLNDTLRFKQLLSGHFALNVRDMLNAVVMGEYGQTRVPVFDYVYVNGRKINIDEETRRQIEDGYQAALTEQEYWQQTTGYVSPWHTALGVSDMTAALGAPKPVPFVCSTYLKGPYGYHDVFCSVPVKLGLGLLQEITPLVLSPATKTRLDYSVETIRRQTAAALNPAGAD